MKNKLTVPKEIIENKILIMREEKVILSIHIAELYNVETKVLNQAVKRNIGRFPDDFMFQLTEEETRCLVSQNVTPHIKYFGGHLPYAFTEQGVAMLSGVLKSQRAVAVNIAIIRAFASLRKLLSSHKELTEKLKKLDEKVGKHNLEIYKIFEAIRQLMRFEDKPRKKIGFLA